MGPPFLGGVHLSGSDAAEWNYQGRTGENEQNIGNKDPAKTQIRTMLDQ